MHEYFQRVPFAVSKKHNERNMPLETGLMLLREENVQRIRVLSVQLDDWLVVRLVFRGTPG